MVNLNGLGWLALGLIVVGGINWGLIGAFDIDLVSSLFGEMTMVTKIVYGLVGLSALYSVYILSAKTQQS